MSAPVTLLQIGPSPFNAVFEDISGATAFTLDEAERTPTAPNTCVRLRQDYNWSQLHHNVQRGPRQIYFYFGPESAPGSGYVMYGSGNAGAQSMGSVVRVKKGQNGWRYFSTFRGKELKWRLTSSPDRMECLDGNRVIAVYEAKSTDQPRPAPARMRGMSQSSSISPLTAISPPISTASPLSNGNTVPYGFMNGHAHGASPHAVLTLQPGAMMVITEVVTTLMLIRMGLVLGW